MIWKMKCILFCFVLCILICDVISSSHIIGENHQSFKSLQLFNITTVKQLCNLGKHICRALKLRADTL